MNTEEKRDFLLKLDEELCIGGVTMSEWTCFLVRDVDTAFCNHANLSAILAAQSAIECHLRFEYSGSHSGNRIGFYDVIEQSPLELGLKAELHRLRQFRNQWVHVRDPMDDVAVLAQSEVREAEIEKFAAYTMELLRRVLYLEQWI